MSRDIQPRRVMSEIQNIPSTIPEKRRNSLGFEMVSFSKRPTEFESKIPRPVSLSLSTNPPLRQPMSSSLSRSPISSRPNPRDSLTEINRFRNLKHKLSKHLGPQPQIKDDIISTPAQIEPQRIHTDNSQLKREVSVLEEHERQLTYELQALIRDQRKLRRNIESTENDIQMYSLRLRREEESHKKEINNKEQLVDTQLGQLALNQEAEYKEIKFAMENEIKDAKLYRDDVAAEEIKTIQEEIEVLKKELHEINDSKQLSLNQESIALESEINKFLKDKTEEVDNLSTQFEEKEEEINRVYAEYQALNAKVTEKDQEVIRLQETIRSIESNMNNFASIKSGLFKDLSTTDAELLEAKKNGETHQESYDKVNQSYLTTLKKVQKNEAQRRIFENSILDYQGKIRVYAISDEGHNNTLQHGNKEYQFNKIVPTDTQISDEFSCLVVSSITGGFNVSVVFTGAENPSVVSSILNSFHHLLLRTDSLLTTKGLDFKFLFKSIGLNEDRIVDLLNSEAPIEINSLHERLSPIPAQPMIIEKDIHSKEFEQILNKCNEVPTDAKIHIISIEITSDHKRIDCDIAFMDITSMASQSVILSKFPNLLSGQLGKFLEFAYCQTKCLFVANINYNKELTSFLDALQKIQETDTPYKRR